MTFPIYAIATETLNGVVDLPSMHAEIVALAIGSAVFQGVREEKDADTLTTLFDVTPNGSDQTTIDNAVAAHTGVAAAFQSIISQRLIATSPGISTTTGTSPVEKLSLSTPPELQTGDYILNWNFACNLDSTARDFLARIQQNDTGGAIGGIPGTNLMDLRQEPSNGSGTGFGGSDQIYLAGGNNILLGLSGAHKFDLDFASSFSGVTAAIASAIMIFSRLD